MDTLTAIVAVTVSKKKKSWKMWKWCFVYSRIIIKLKKLIFLISTDQLTDKLSFSLAINQSLNFQTQSYKLLMCLQNKWPVHSVLCCTSGIKPH